MFQVAVRVRMSSRICSFSFQLLIVAWFSDIDDMRLLICRRLITIVAGYLGDCKKHSLVISCIRESESPSLHLNRVI